MSRGWRAMKLMKMADNDIRLESLPWTTFCATALLSRTKAGRRRKKEERGGVLVVLQLPLGLSSSSLIPQASLFTYDPRLPCSRVFLTRLLIQITTTVTLCPCFSPPRGLALNLVRYKLANYNPKGNRGQETR